jgi:hypothetical protein
LRFSGRRKAIREPFDNEGIEAGEDVCRSRLADFSHFLPAWHSWEGVEAGAPLPRGRGSASIRARVGALYFFSFFARS